MDLDLTDDQHALRELASAFFAKESPPSVVRAAEPNGFDPKLWSHVVELGLPAVTVPESLGGGGGGHVDLAIVVEEHGRSLAPVPLIEASVANHLLAVLADGGSDDAARALGHALAGDSLATVALRPALHRASSHVPAAAVADAVIILDRDELVLVQRDDIGTATPLPVTPNLAAMPIADCRLDEGERLVLASGPVAVEAHRRAVATWQLLTGVALVGLGARALELGHDYVLERRAFGVLIATFQTIQHRLADNATALDGARLLAYEAAWATDAAQPRALELATMAFLFAGETANKTAADSLQFHGGYGYTLEYDIQLYLRRARAWSLIAGDPRHLNAELTHRLHDEEEG